MSRQQLIALLSRRTGLVLVALALLGWVSNRWTPLAWLPPAALAVLALVLLGRALRLEVTSGGDPTLGFSVGLLVLAAGLGGLGTWVLAAPWLVLAGVSLAFVGVAGVGSRLRHRWRRSWIVPSVAAVTALGLSAAGAVLAGRLDSRLPIVVYALSIVAGYLAIVFGTEPWISLAGPLARNPRVRLIGVAALAAGTLWLALAGSGLYAGAALGIVAIMTLLATLDGDGEIIIVLLLLALVWAVFPRSVPRTPIEDLVAGDHPIAVYLGDSYQSGEGAERYVAGTNVRGENVCRRAPTAWSQLVHEQPVVAVSLACSGAAIRHINGSPQYRGEPIEWPDGVGDQDGADQLTQLEWLLDEVDGDRIDSVTVTIGGNDAGFARAGIACVSPGNCSDLAPVFVARFPDLERRLAALYDEIRASMDARGATGVPLRATGYPVPLSEEGCGWTWLSSEEHAFITRFIDLLNGSVAEAASRADVDYVDTIPSSLEATGLRFCEAGPGRGGLNFFEFNPMEGSLLAALDPRNWVNNSFHPNEDGHRAMADAFLRWSADGSSEAVGVIVVPDGEAPCTGRDACDEFVAAWSRREIALFVRAISAPIILLFTGSWLLLTPLVAVLRTRRFELTGPLLAAAERVL
ncbi:MAG: SGNH/GDSL hydrolase family protein [Acidimicrobiia bacterium]|nr:SGNH/GDSL hydrolase family protein [Acidimicrobiia bacterium]